MTEDGKLVLVVDDDPDARTFMTTLLEDNGWRTVTAKNGEEALSRLKEEKPALVSLDITMPEKSGVAVYRALREEDGTKDIPVIIVTGVSDDFKTFISSRRKVPPPDDYVSKPVDPELFMGKVRKLLG